MARRSIERWSDAVYRAPNASFDNVCLPASSRVSNGETRTFVLWITPFNEGLGLVGYRQRAQLWITQRISLTVAPLVSR
jgi:hypothetical protein